MVSCWRSVKDCCRTICLQPGVKCVIIFEFLSRFSYYGILAATFMFFKHELHISLHHSIALVHTFILVFYMFALFGLIFADSYIGRGKALILFLVVAIIGNCIISYAATSPGVGGMIDNIWLMLTATLIGYFLRSVGAGSIRATTALFGEDQFYSYQHRGRGYYFGMMFFVLCAGTMLGVAAVPALRMQFSCYELNYCFPLGFLVPSMALIIGLAVVAIGCIEYYQAQERRNALVEVCRCMLTAWKNKGASTGGDWLDNALVAYDERFIRDVRRATKAATLFLPLPFFWMLSEQMWSRWIYQGTFMDGQLTANYGLEPDNMPLFHSLFLLIIYPLFECVLFPVLAVCHLCRSPHWKVATGALFAILAALAAAILQYKLEPYFYKPIEPGTGDIMFWNSIGCTVDLKTNITTYEELLMPPTGMLHLKGIPMDRFLPFTAAVSTRSCWPNGTFKCVTNTMSPYDVQLLAIEGVVSHYLFEVRSYAETYIDADRDCVIIRSCHCWGGNLTNPPSDDIPFRDFTKDELQLAKLGIVNNLVRWIKTDELKPRHPILEPPENDFQLSNHHLRYNKTFILDPNHRATEFNSLIANTYTCSINKSEYNINSLSNEEKTVLPLGRGGVYAVFVLIKANPFYTVKLFELVPPNIVPITWQLIHLLFIALAQYLCPVTLLQYSYSQVARRMHPFLLLFWLLMIAIGNLFLIFYAEFNLFRREFYNYVVMAVLTLLWFFGVLIMMFNHTHIDPVLIEDEAEREEWERVQEEQWREERETD